MSRCRVTLVDAASTVAGARGDAYMWDMWRARGDAWARRYLRGEIARGVDRVGDDAAIRRADAVIGVTS